ncbi:MAG: hypothetical protein AAF479_04690, partial [Pseudomonadota bacterium]
MLVVLVLGAGVVLARLSAAPLEMPWLAATLSEMASETSDRFDLRIGNVTLRLNSGDRPSGIVLSDVAAYAPDGTLLMSAPRVVARLRLADLIQGDLRPTRIALIRPSVEIVRADDGRFRIGLGTNPEFAQLPFVKTEAPEEESAPGFDALARVMDGFAGDIEPVPELSALTAISIIGFDLKYDDEVLHQTWRTENADVRIWRVSDGVEARLTATIGEEAGAQIPIVLSASRGQGDGATKVEARQGQARLWRQIEPVGPRDPSSRFGPWS